MIPAQLQHLAGITQLVECQLPKPTHANEAPSETGKPQQKPWCTEVHNGSEVVTDTGSLPASSTGVDPHWRFWSKVAIKRPDECWLWSAGRTDNGYGSVRVDGRSKRAHRYAWELTHGRPVPPDTVIRHRCDRKLCCNPRHLEAGTQADNMDDRRRRGRINHTRGDSHHRRPKLNLQKAREIRRRNANGESYSVLAADFGVTVPTISAVVNEKTWREKL